ncbi:F-box only protein 21 isoform X2 [Corythoichthys intestinalis]|uniref:F-box only protein 21 isoform X2 n=1 Tax=Corythoichthys intestinalis TaxID=161448 RepID=UPI0025A633CA|nr:F-box only protein 21 isoform X2 [Corythoichthys intestinalis]XP_061811537.1 F-box only protein 21-like [Nerophis lumbriciformis]
MAACVAGERLSSPTGTGSEAGQASRARRAEKLTDLPTELLEHILCFPVLEHVDICNVSCCCLRLRDVCHSRGKVWGHQYKLRWPRLQRFYPQNESCDWLREYKTRHWVGIQIRRTVESISKRFFMEVPCIGQVLGDSFTEIESLGMPMHFCEDELLFILSTDKRKSLTLKYYAKKILYFLRQQNILRALKSFLEQPPEQQSAIAGAVLVDQYCNPLAEVTLDGISAQLDDIVEKVKKTLRVKNPSHPSLRVAPGGERIRLDDFELQRQVFCALNAVLYEQLQYKGDQLDYYNPFNSYIHQVLLRRKGIPISLSVVYMTLAQRLGVKLEPVNFPSHFLLRWCQKERGSDDIYDYVYIDAFGKGKQMTAKECEYLIGHQASADFYGGIGTTEMLLRMVGNLLNIGKRGEGKEKSYQLLRNTLDLFLTINPDNVSYLLLQARLYFHLGIWPEKVLDILQHIQALDPSQHGSVVYLVQHTLEHIQHKKQPTTPEVKRRGTADHLEVRYSVGLVMKHKRSGYNCVIYGWDPKCTMSQEWITTMRVHQLPDGAEQPFYNVLVQDGTCRYAAQENLEPHSDPLEIGHPEVGRYFSEFAHTYYVANDELRTRYPDDSEHTDEVARDLYPRPPLPSPM